MPSGLCYRLFLRVQRRPASAHSTAVGHSSGCAAQALAAHVQRCEACCNAVQHVAVDGGRSELRLQTLAREQPSSSRRGSSDLRVGLHAAASQRSSFDGKAPGSRQGWTGPLSDAPIICVERAYLIRRIVVVLRCTMPRLRLQYGADHPSPAAARTSSLGRSPHGMLSVWCVVRCALYAVQRKLYAAPTVSAASRPMRSARMLAVCGAWHVVEYRTPFVARCLWC